MLLNEPSDKRPFGTMENRLSRNVELPDSKQFASRVLDVWVENVLNGKHGPINENMGTKLLVRIYANASVESGWKVSSFNAKLLSEDDVRMNREPFIGNPADTLEQSVENALLGADNRTLDDKLERELKDEVRLQVIGVASIAIHMGFPYLCGRNLLDTCVPPNKQNYDRILASDKAGLPTPTFWLITDYDIASSQQVWFKSGEKVRQFFVRADHINEATRYHTEAAANQHLDLAGYLKGDRPQVVEYMAIGDKVEQVAKKEDN